MAGIELDNLSLYSYLSGPCVSAYQPGLNEETIKSKSRLAYPKIEFAEFRESPPPVTVSDACFQITRYFY